MPNVLLKLTEISEDCQEPKYITVDTNFTADLVLKYIQHFKNTEDSFTLYINKEVFNSSLDVVMSKYGLCTESQISIEYEKNKIDEIIDFNSQISFLKYNIYDQNLFIGFYNLPLRVFRKNKFYNTTGVRLIAFNSKRLFGFIFTVGIIDLEKLNESNSLEEIIYDNLETSVNSTQKRIDFITNMILDNETLFYGTTDGRCYAIENFQNKKLLFQFQDSTITGIFKLKNQIYFVALNGEIACKEKIVKKEFNITCADSNNSVVFFGTSTNGMYKFNESTEIKYDVELRYISFIKIINENLIVIANQYAVQVLQLEPYNVIKNYKFDDEISGLEYFDGMIYTSAGSKLYKFKI